MKLSNCCGAELVLGRCSDCKENAVEELEENEYKLVCPRYLDLPRKTKKDRRVHINLNTYRNLDRFTENQAKVLYKEVMREQIEKLPELGVINATFKVYQGTKIRLDKHNVVAITKKYLFDALVELGKLVDDNDLFIKDELTLPSEYDRGRGRVEVLITKIT